MTDMILLSVLHSFLRMTSAHTHVFATDAIHFAPKFVCLFISQCSILNRLEHWKVNESETAPIPSKNGLKVNCTNLVVCPGQIVQSPRR
jgi:hypothetical protein